METPGCGKQPKHDGAGPGHNWHTMAPPLVLMGDTCNRIRVRTPGGTTWGDGAPTNTNLIKMSMYRPYSIYVQDLF